MHILKAPLLNFGTSCSNRLFRFGLVRSYGLLSEPGLACSAFDEMQRLQIWQPADVKTANALLNAVHADATTTYTRYIHICSMPWGQSITQQADVVKHRIAPDVKCSSHCHGIICATCVPSRWKASDLVCCSTCANALLRQANVA